jgi:hypothetical protein
VQPVGLPWYKADITTTKEMPMLRFDHSEIYLGNPHNGLLVETITGRVWRQLKCDVKEDVVVEVCMMSPELNQTYMERNPTSGGMMGCTVYTPDIKVIMLNMHVNVFDYIQHLPLVLAHELVHLAQMASGRMVTRSSGIHLWEGREVDSKAIPYVDYPWEREAIAMQLPLATSVMDPSLTLLAARMIVDCMPRGAF